MKITYLGTAAAEGFPAVFCNCDYCIEAKKLKGKNVRTRSQAIINEDLLIDLPADTYSHFLNNDIDGDKIKYLIVTHSHQDHFYPSELAMRRVPFAHNMRAEKIEMLCSIGAYEMMNGVDNLSEFSIDFRAMRAFEQVMLDAYTITALPARHYEGDGALFYIVSDASKTVLYAHDTGYFYDEVFEYIKNSDIFFDLISLDCTNVDIPIADNGTHMGLENIERVVNKLENMGAVNDKTIKVINHFSHNAAPIHHKLEERVKDVGYLVAYDGMCIEI